MASRGEAAAPEPEGARAPGFIKRAFKQNGANPGPSPKQGGKPGVAQVPSTVLTVEYVDGSDGMEAALRAMEERLSKLDQLSSGMQESISGLVAGVNKQAREIEQFIQSLNRRVDRIYQEISQGLAGALPLTEATSSGAAQAPAETFEVPEQYAEAPDHQKAWRLARVMAADMEEYYGDQVREGALYDNFFKLLEKPIGEARRTFQDRVPAKVRGEFDYVELALKELLARKKRQLAEELDAQ